MATIDYRLLKVVSNKEKIQLKENDGGEGDLASCTASDSTCSNIGLGFAANNIVDDDEDDENDDD